MVSSPFFTDKNVSGRGIFIPPLLLLARFLYQVNPSLVRSPGLDGSSLFIVPEAAGSRLVAGGMEALARQAAQEFAFTELRYSHLLTNREVLKTRHLGLLCLPYYETSAGALACAIHARFRSD
jgi:hypothetical protein